MKKIKMSASISGSVFFFMVIFHYFVNTSSILEGNTITISNGLPILFKPAGYAFFVWILVYLLLTSWLLVQFIPRFRHNHILDRVGTLFVASCGLNLIWIIFWHQQQFFWTFLVLTALLGLLLLIYQKIANNTDASFVNKLPFCVYIGWISVMTSVNLAVILQTYYLSSLNIHAEVWPILMLLAGTVFAIWFTIRHQDAVYPLVFIWVYISIAINQSAYPSIVLTAAFMVLLLVLSMLWIMFRNTTVSDSYSLK